MDSDKIAKNLLAEHTCDTCRYGPIVEGTYCLMYPEEETCEDWDGEELDDT